MTAIATSARPTHFFQVSCFCHLPFGFDAVMAPLKRKSSVNDSSNSKKPKASSTSAPAQHHASSAFEPNAAGARAQGFSSLVTSGPSETAFPRGGGTKLSAAEVKAAQREGKREADAAVDHTGAAASGAPKAKKPRRDVCIFITSVMFYQKEADHRSDGLARSKNQTKNRCPPEVKTAKAANSRKTRSV